ncbi:MAG: glycosyltransferase family 9 protein [Gammaproteobacteria bacterium]|nr:glycosyltransferase family 9 protein [Gammaproteobacteria bacterium]
MPGHGVYPISVESHLSRRPQVSTTRKLQRAPAPVLIIKLGALGDFFMALPAMRAVRDHHADRPLHLLTIPALAGLARDSGLFDAVFEDPKAAFPLGHWRMARLIRNMDCHRVYDLQGTKRTAWYFRLIGRHAPEWAGPVRGCALPRPPRPPGAHRCEWYAAQLQTLGITVPPSADPVWLHAEIRTWALPSSYCLVAAGGSAHRPGKRWPTQRYIALLKALAPEMKPVLIGTAVDAEANREIAGVVPGAIDLTGRTSLAALASLAREARFAVGNDTGPMHVIAATDCASVVLYSQESDPGFIAPLGSRVTCLQRPVLEQLGVDEVLEAIRVLTSGAAGVTCVS